MGSFSDDIKAFTAKVEAKTQTIFVNTVAAAKDSIVLGSPITGAPGQPVAFGTLRASWNTEFELPTSARITTNLGYAEPVELGIGPHGPVAYGAKNGIGGSHSVAHTMTGLPLLLADETRKAAT